MQKISTLLIASVFFLACIENNNELAGRAKNGLAYPPIVDSLNLQKLFDDTKWHLYLLRCDDTPKNESGNLLLTPEVSYASMDLRFDSLNYRVDTVKIYFTYYLENNPVNCMAYPNMKRPPSIGMGRIKNVDTIIWYFTNCLDATAGICSFVPRKYFDTTSDRSIRPLQPDVIKYLNEHKSALNPWLYKEAKKRGVLKE